MAYTPTDEELAALAALSGDQQQPIAADPGSDIQMATQRQPPPAQITDDVAAVLQGMAQGKQPVEGSYQVAHGAGGGLASPPPAPSSSAAPNPTAAAQTGWQALTGTTATTSGLKPPPPPAPATVAAPDTPPPPAAPAAVQPPPTPIVPGTEARAAPATQTPAQVAAAEAVRTGKPVPVPGGQGLTALPNGQLSSAPPAEQPAEPKAAAAAVKTEPPQPAPQAPKAAETNLAPGDTPPAGGTTASTGLGAGDQPPGGPTQIEPEPVTGPKAVPSTAGATGPTGGATPPSAGTSTGTPGTAAAAAPNPDLAKPVTDPHAWLESRRGVENASGDPNAKNPRSSASGLYQITDGTYQATLAKHPELAGLSKNDEKVALAVFGDMKAALTPLLGHEPTAHEMNASWLLGPAGAAKALTADQNAPITNVVNAAQLAANPQWQNKDGSPKTVGQVLSEYDTGHTGGGGGGGGTAVAAGPTQPGYADLFKMQQARIDAYQQGQGKLFDQLAQMQKDYLAQTKPSPYDQLSDSFTNWAMAHNAAMANKFATQGGIVHKALPNPAPFQTALAAGQAQVNQQRQMAQDRAKTGLQFGSDMIKLKAETDYKSLGLSGDLAKNLVDSQFQQQRIGMDQQRIDLEANKVKLELAQFGQANSEKLDGYLKDAVGDPAIRSAILQEAMSGGLDTTKSLQENLPKLNEIIQKHVTAGENITGKPNLYQMTWVDKDGHTQHDTIDIGTGQGRARREELRKEGGATYREVPMQQGQQINVPVTYAGPGGAGGGGAGGGAGGDETPPLQQKQQAQSLSVAAQGALALLPYIRAHGDSSMLTGPDGNKIAAAIKQVTGIDYTGVDVRTVYNKLMDQVQTGLVLPSMKDLGGRPTGGEFQVIRQGQLGSEATTTAAEAFLHHVLKTADYTSRKSDFIINAAHDAKLRNDTNFDLPYEINKWGDQKGNQLPTWDSQALLDAVRKQQEGAKAGGGGGSPGNRAAAPAAKTETPNPAVIPPQAAAVGVDGKWQYHTGLGIYRSPDGKTFVDRMGVPVNEDGTPKKKSTAGSSGNG